MTDFLQSVRESWMLDAACRGMDVSVFFPFRGETERAQAAKRICAGCPVREECLEFALVNHEREGIWGGTCEKDRRRIRRERRA